MLNTRDQIRDSVYQFIEERKPGLLPSDDPSNDQLELDQVLDSFETFDLVQHLEAAFDISINNEDTTRQNLGSVQAILDFVARKQAG